MTTTTECQYCGSRNCVPIFDEQLKRVAGTQKILNYKCFDCKREFV